MTTTTTSTPAFDQALKENNHTLLRLLYDSAIEQRNRAEDHNRALTLALVQMKAQSSDRAPVYDPPLPPAQRPSKPSHKVSVRRAVTTTHKKQEHEKPVALDISDLE